ncbi:cytochrome P450 [Tothia fuscella]|uniref:Cytochrome P450 n=1 Tax=Tothia fuscella TaxID=1048955 RepID=A0A9P4NQ50_9PEZI|nr:cytochrome P450 [Tothia fuscella]
MSPSMNSLLALLFSCLSAWLLHLIYKTYTHRKWFQDKPGPPHSLLWGHLKVMGDAAATMPPNTHPQAYMTSIAQKYDLEGIFYLDLYPASVSMVVLTEPTLMDHIAITKPLRVHPMAEELLSPMLGTNIIAAANGAVWKMLHKAMAPAFNWGHVRGLTGLFVEETLEFRRALDKLAESEELFSMEDVSAKLVFDIIARVVFNYSLHAQTKGSQVLEDLRQMVKLAENAAFSWSPVDKVKTWFARRKVLGRLNPEIEGKLKERFELLKEEGVVPSRKDAPSILDLMLRDKLASGETTLLGADVELLVANIKGLLVGGHGTSTDTLCFIYILLSTHPDVLSTIREEHSKVFAENIEDTIAIFQENPSKLAELEYTSAVIKETLRLFPVGYGVREAPDGYTVTYNHKTYPLDHDLMVVSCSHTLHYNPQIYPSPTTFNPSRFIDPTDPNTKNCFRTFGRGSRACLGQNMAIEELKVILLLTVREYDFLFEKEEQVIGSDNGGKRRTEWTNLDEVYGDVVFQELGLEARPRGGVMMRVRKVGR